MLKFEKRGDWNLVTHGENDNLLAIWMSQLTENGPTYKVVPSSTGKVRIFHTREGVEKYMAEYIHEQTGEKFEPGTIFCL